MFKINLTYFHFEISNSIIWNWFNEKVKYKAIEDIIYEHIYYKTIKL